MPEDQAGVADPRARGALAAIERAFANRARLTPLGAVFAALCGGVGLCAWFTGNNFLFAIFSGMVSAWVLSRVALVYSLSEISVSRSVPPEIYAGVPARIAVTVTNGKKRLKTFGLTVRDMVDLPAFHDGPPAHFPIVAPGGSGEAEVTMRFRRRGRYRATSWCAETSFPFGFFSARVTGKLAGEFLVFPRPRRMSSSMLPQDAELMVYGSRQASRTGEEDEFKGLRCYVPGDPPNRIHWKTSARTRALMVRETESFSLPKVTLLLDTSAADGVSVLRKGVGIERGVRIAASLAADLSARNVEFRFGAPGLNPQLTRFGSGPAHLRGILEILAELGPSGPGLDEAMFKEAARRGDSGSFVVLVLSRKRAREVSASLARLSNSRLRVVDVSMPDKVRGPAAGRTSGRP